MSNEFFLRNRTLRRSNSAKLLLVIFLTTLFQLMLFGCAKAATPIKITPLTSLLEDLNLANQTKRPLMLVFSTSHCGYCTQVKEDFVQPMLINKAYEAKVIIRLVEVDDGGPIVGADGGRIARSELAEHFGVDFFPTVLFVGPKGEEVAKRLIGITTVDFYGGYLDRAIAQAGQRMNGNL